MVVILSQLDLYLCMQSVAFTTNIVSSNPPHGEMYSLHHYVIKFVDDLRQVSGFSVLSDFFQQNWLPRYNWNIAECGVKPHSRIQSQFIRISMFDWVLLQEFFILVDKGSSGNILVITFNNQIFKGQLANDEFYTCNITWAFLFILFTCPMGQS